MLDVKEMGEGNNPMWPGFKEHLIKQGFHTAPEDMPEGHPDLPDIAVLWNAFLAGGREQQRLQKADRERQLTLPQNAAEARQRKVCRVCGRPCGENIGGPLNWETRSAAVQIPERITLNYGKEYAHTDCLAGM